jgi:hypothetical protein
MPFGTLRIAMALATNKYSMSKPIIYRKWAIFLFSMLGTTFFGGLLYSANLKAVNKKRYITPTMVFSIFWYGGVNLFLKEIDFPVIKYLVINSVGGIILIKPFWNYHLPNLIEYKNRKTTGPFIAVLLPIALVFFLNWINRPIKKSQEESHNDFTAVSDSAALNSIFVFNDSIVEFEKLFFTLPAYSYYYTVNSENIKMIHSTIYFEDGEFSIKCVVIELNKNANVSPETFKSKVDSFNIIDKKYSFANNGFVGNYENYQSDTLSAKGQIVVFSWKNTSYMLSTDYPKMNSVYGDSLSDYLFQKIYY